MDNETPQFVIDIDKILETNSWAGVSEEFLSTLTKEARLWRTLLPEIMLTIYHLTSQESYEEIRNDLAARLGQSIIATIILFANGRHPNHRAALEEMHDLITASLACLVDYRRTVHDFEDSMAQDVLEHIGEGIDLSRKDEKDLQA